MLAGIWESHTPWREMRWWPELGCIHGCEHFYVAVDRCSRKHRGSGHFICSFCLLTLLYSYIPHFTSTPPSNCQLKVALVNLGKGRQMQDKRILVNHTAVC